MKRASISDFLASPVGRFAVGRTVLVGCPDPRLRVCAIWGRPDENDARELLELLQVIFHRDLAPELDAVTDVMAAREVTPAAFAALIDGLIRNRVRFAGRIRRQAFVRSTGVVGAVVGGLYSLIGPTFPVRLFDDHHGAFEWLGRTDGPCLADWLRALVTREVDQQRRVLDDLEPYLETHPAASLEDAAAALSVSPRVLQRQLRATGTSFRREHNRARVRAAERLLCDGLKVSAVAREVGVASLQRFRKLFRTVTGLSPAEWRSTRAR